MEKQEFEQMVGTLISDANYSIIKTVQQSHPVISDEEEVVELYRNFGMLIFYDMFPRAEMSRKVEDQIHRAYKQVKRMEEELDEIYNKEVNYEKWLKMVGQERETDAPESMGVLEKTITAKHDENVDYEKMVEKLKRVGAQPL